MYRAKDRGRARYELFDERMRARAVARLRVENDLRRALERRELRLEYQPVVHLPDERIAAVEALLRWEHPERGAVPPEEFIPVAEENGLIDRIGRWVLDTACRQAAAWTRMRPSEPIAMAVNLSPQQLHHRDFPAIVARTLDSTGLDPQLLRFEITEALLLDERDGPSEILRALKALGVRLVLDDFGTGYSSLGYLTRLPLDALKVDRSFVQGLGGGGMQTAITEAIVGMAQALSLGVVGEGVETRVQAEELQRLGACYAQGFLFSHPIPAQGISALLKAEERVGGERIYSG
jgi:EAL domain-containing protein (putative c-di-GMP-specific phosphodiesterase class I)